MLLARGDKGAAGEAEHERSERRLSVLRPGTVQLEAGEGGEVPHKPGEQLPEGEVLEDEHKPGTSGIQRRQREDAATSHKIRDSQLLV